MNMYEIIRRRFLEGDLTAEDVVQRARCGILSFKEAGQIITLKKENKEVTANDAK